MAHNRALRRTALTREELANMSDEDLAARLSAREMKDITALTRATFDRTPLKKKSDESTGQFRQRTRQAQTIDEVEFARSARQNAEAWLYNSKAEKKNRLQDFMSSTVTPESIAARKKADAERAKRDQERDRLSDLSAVPYPKGVAGPSVEWESGKEGKGKK